MGMVVWDEEIHQTEGNTDDTDKLKPQFTLYRACFACPSFNNWTDSHGFEVSDSNHYFMSFVDITLLFFHL